MTLTQAQLEVLSRLPSKREKIVFLAKAKVKRPLIMREVGVTYGYVSSALTWARKRGINVPRLNKARGRRPRNAPRTPQRIDGPMPTVLLAKPVAIALYRRARAAGARVNITAAGDIYFDVRVQWRPVNETAEAIIEAGA